MTQRAAMPARARGRPKKVRVPPLGEVTYPQRDEDDGPSRNGSDPGGNPFASLTLNEEALQPLKLAYRDDAAGIWLYQGDCIEVLEELNKRYPEGRFDAIFADPPYFLSNGGITCHAGKMVKVDKGEWDKSKGAEVNHEFNTEWLKRCQKALKPNGTIWVTGTHHVIFSIGYAMQQLGFKILNDIAWEKPNPPPNLSCRYFTHSTETVLWAAKNEKSKHVFNYAEMRKVTGKQMKTVWTMSAPKNGEKTHGKHPTQKPVGLVERCLLASTMEGDLVLDPFLGGGTTAVAALRAGRKCVGIELEMEYLVLAANRCGSDISGLKKLNESAILVRLEARVSIRQGIDLDPVTKVIDPSGAMAQDSPPERCERVFHETKFVFLSCARADTTSIVHTTVDASFESAWERAPTRTRVATTHIVRCETEIFRVKEG